MTSHSIGEISLSFSTIIYMIWLLPQLRLNFKRKNTEGLSFCWHTLLCLGYGTDLIYGVGLHMQWQYLMVSIVGLCSLLIQHWQFGRYGLQHHLKPSHYLSVSILIVSLLIFSMYTIRFTQHTETFYNMMGALSNTCFLLYVLPQILRNHINQSTLGLSTTYVLLALVLSVCDITSAYTLHWNWPSVVGPVTHLLMKLILLCQVYCYRKNSIESAYA